jgi:transcriptional regulator with XRE-family HTH domain
MSKRIDPADKIVGKNIRIFRRAKGLSQAELGHALGITFQQVQKYENGRNRVGSGRLMAIARTLGVPIERFFSGTVPGSLASAEIVTDLLSSPYAIELLKALSKIDDITVRRTLVALTESIAARFKS